MSVATERAALFAQGLDIVKREDWGAVCSYTSPRSVVTPASFLFLHVAVIRQSGDPAKDMRVIERIGQDRFGIGCSYNAAASFDARLWEMQPLGRRGAHTVNDKRDPRFPAGSLNHVARALVLPQMDGDPVSDGQIDVAARWAAACIRAGFVKPGAVWFGHRDVAWKGCPGDAGYRRLPELNRLTRYYETHGLEETVLMALTDQEQQDLHRWVRETTELVRQLAPFPPERISRAGEIVPRGTDGSVVTQPWVRWVIETTRNSRELDAAEFARRVLADLGDVALSDGQVRSIIDAMPQAVKQALREGAG